MAKNTGNKRVAVKHIRDGIKSNYKKDYKCAVCDTTEDLELHHFATVSLLLKRYCNERDIPISTDEEVLAMRDTFYKEHWHELVIDTVTLCNTHHKLLHKVYGREPDLSTAEKQKIWVSKTRDKLLGRDADSADMTPEENRFSKLLDSELTDMCNRFTRLLDKGD